SDGDSSRPKSLIVSKESYDQKQAEYENLVNVLIPENKQAIATAREHGDLRENAEYKMARQDQETLMARKAQPESELGRAPITDFSDAPVDVVGVGSVVDLLQSSNNKSVTYAILGAWDSDPEKHVVSYQTPLGTKLISKKVGETISIEVDSQSEEYTIKAIRRWVDATKA